MKVNTNNTGWQTSGYAKLLSISSNLLKILFLYFIFPFLDNFLQIYVFSCEISTFPPESLRKHSYSFPILLLSSALRPQIPPSTPIKPIIPIPSTPKTSKVPRPIFAKNPPFPRIFHLNIANKRQKPEKSRFFQKKSKKIF